MNAFEEVRIGPLVLKNRILKAATFEGMTPNALVTDDLISFHRRVAEGGAAMTTVAYLAVSGEGRTDRAQIYWREEAIAGLRALTDGVHAAGAAACAQIGHAGPVANPRSTGEPAVAPSRTVTPFGIVRAATEADLARIIEAHRRAAQMAERAGFDAVEIHMGHGYLTSAFLSPKMNRRGDEWGANRTRFARAIAAAVRAAVSGRLAIIAKLGLEDGVRGGAVISDCVRLAQMLEADGSVDALELTAGSSLSNPMYIFRGDVPLAEFAAAVAPLLPASFLARPAIRLFGGVFLRSYPYEPLYLLPLAKQVRQAVKLPLVALGGITDLATIDRALAEGFELVAMARALLKEPDLVRRMRSEVATRSSCTHCNRCMPSIYSKTRCVLVEP